MYGNIMLQGRGLDPEVDINAFYQKPGVGDAEGAARRNASQSFLSFVILGVGIGASGALGLTHLMSGMLFGIEPADPATFAVVSILMVSLAALACLLPARRAARIDPILALRNE